MAYLIFALIVIACVGMIGIVLIQNPKGGGISSSFGALNQIGGVKQTTEGVEKITWVLAIAIVVLCLLATPYMKGSKAAAGNTANPESSIPMSNLPVNAPVNNAPANGAPANSPAQP